MIDLIQLHEALRWSGLGPDVPFHATDSSHEMKMRKFLEELGDTQLADEVIDELKRSRGDSRLSWKSEIARSAIYVNSFEPARTRRQPNDHHQPRIPRFRAREVLPRG
jgi:hypothetical protein